MKTKSIKYILAAGLVCCGLSTTFTSCGDVLDEQPRSTFDPSFFTTKTGIEGGLTSLYAHLRYFYGNGYYLNTLETGTDEYTYAQSADGNFKDADLSGVGSVTSTSTVAGGAWGTLFANINTCNGIIENGAAAGIDDALLAEAYFFRAFDYFILVQTYGGVPLDLGAGELKFNTTTIRTSVRNTVPEVYKVILVISRKLCLICLIILVLLVLQPRTWLVCISQRLILPTLGGWRILTTFLPSQSAAVMPARLTATSRRLTIPLWLPSTILAHTLCSLHSMM